MISQITVVAADKGNIYAMILIGDGYSVTSIDLMKNFLDGNTMNGYSIKANNIKTYAYNTSFGVTKADIDKCINQTFKNATAEDICFFYYGGHGSCNTNTKKGMGLTLIDEKNQKTYYPYGDLAKKLTAFKGKSYVILDCCYAGEFINEIKKLLPYRRDKITVMTASGDKPTGLKIFTSGWDIIRKDKQYMRFTYMIAKGVGIKGGNSLKADKNKNGKVTLKELYDYVNNIINTSNPQYYGNNDTVLYQTSIKLDRKKVTLNLAGNKSIQLKATSSVSDSKITWKSSNTSIAVVNSKGKVTAKKSGKVIISAESKGAIAKCEITVNTTNANTLKGFAGGDGTKNNPFKVKTFEQLKQIKNYRNKYFVQIANIDCKGKIMETMFSEDFPFTGTYDGRKYTISNLVLIPSNYRLGIFGETGEESVLKNIYLSNITATINTSVRLNAGALAGEAKGKIIGCQVKKINISIIDTSSEVNACGGIAGRILGTISDSKAYNVSISTTRDVGGVAGGVTQNGIVSNCYANNISIKATGGAGAVVGALAYASVSNCSAEGNLQLSGCWKHDTCFGYIQNVTWK